MSGFPGYDALMGTGQVGAAACGTMLPPAIMIAFQFSLAKGSPANLEKAGQSWESAQQAVRDTSTELRDALDAVSAADWTAEDRQLFDGQVGEFCQQLDILADLFNAVENGLLINAWALMVYAVFAAAMGAFLLSLLAAYVAACATVVGAAPAQSFQAVAATCLTITSVASGILLAASTVSAAIFGIGTEMAVADSAAAGNTAATAAYEQAKSHAGKTALTNLAQNAVNAGINYATGPAGRTVPISGVDLDADRTGDGVWNLGGGATYQFGEGGSLESGTKVTLGGNVQIHEEEGLVGGGVSGKFQTADGVSVGGNVGYTDPEGDGGQLTYGLNGGYEKPHNVSIPGAGENGAAGDVRVASQGGNVQLSGKTDFETGTSDVTLGGNYTANGGNVASPSWTIRNEEGEDPQHHVKADTPFGTINETPPWDK